MELKLVEAMQIDEYEYLEYLTEWEHLGGRIIPASSDKGECSFAQMVEKWTEEKSDAIYEKGLVPATTYFLVDEIGYIYGCLNFRYELNEYLLKAGGHIGYGIRPSWRQKGYATRMLEAGLDKCREAGLTKVLITCDEDNIASAKTIEKCGGVLENMIQDGNVFKKRYWVSL